MSETLNISNEDKGVTMLDVLRDEEALEEDAHAVLGGSDDQFCTYSQGYIKRQALYACKTCTPDGMSNPEKRAGVCLACSYHCHENHDLIELYTKRNFRCDCGGPKMAGNKCNLDPFKSDNNTENKYNQNFSGLYCECHRPYPDPEDKISDEMIQCIICEDWYHTRHLGKSVPPAENYAEMICRKCVETNSFLNCYVELSVINKTKVDDEVEVQVCDDKTPNEQPAHKKIKLDATSSDQNNVDKDCIKPDDKDSAIGSLFWPEGWRKKLCKCTSCMEMYKKLQILFLLDLEDRAQHYEEQGKCKTAKTSQYERGMRALSSLGHVQQVDAITEYNKMTEKLKEYLQKFAESKKVVTEEDIKIFFESIKGSRNPATTNQHFCRICKITQRPKSNIVFLEHCKQIGGSDYSP